MKRLIISLLLLLPLAAHAQFFDFGFDDPFFSRRQTQPQEKVTKPEFKGGQEKLEKYLKSHYKNPVNAERKDGEVVVACILSEKGKVKETHLVRKMGTEWDREAERVCKKMKFKPAKQGKKKVKSRYDVRFPIRRGRLSFSNLKTVDL